MPDEPIIRDLTRFGRTARKLRAVQVSDHFQAILGCLLGEDWTTPRLVEMVITPDGHLLGRCEGEAAFKVFAGTSEGRGQYLSHSACLWWLAVPRGGKQHVDT